MLLLTRDTQGTISFTRWIEQFGYHHKSRLVLEDEQISPMPLQCRQHRLLLFGYMHLDYLVSGPNVKDAEHGRWKVTLA